MKKSRKQICIIGLGQFGSELAKNLVSECEVLAIDIDEDIVNSISGGVHRALCLDARVFNSLASVVTADFDEAVVSMSESIETSVICTLHLKQIGVKHIWAKALNKDHSTILTAIGANEVIFPEAETAGRVAAHITVPNLLDFIPLAENYRAMEKPAPSFCMGKNLRDLHIRKKYGILVMAVKAKSPEKYLFMPGPDYVVTPGDVLVLIGRENSLEEFQRFS